ncbi:MAG: hypothetical protein HY287_09645 [Planctomycetes bacterium]|nr:hypothetical protein [Planctomycetota bacterium]MBI3834576.1 hypothetical protein [Planctomycetota bacterium]
MRVLTTQANNSDDLRFLMSRSLDGDLSADESARLELALAASADLRDERQEMVAVDRLVMEWGSHPVEIDWASHRTLIEARISCDAKAETDANRVDNLLADWVARGNIGEVDLRGRVLAQIRGANRVATPLRWVIRLGLPLAAAAAITIAVLLPNMKNSPMPVSTSIVTFVHSGRADSPFASDAVTMVLFERTLPPSPVTPSGGSMELIVVGSPPTDAPLDESAPL